MAAIRSWFAGAAFGAAGLWSAVCAAEGPKLPARSFGDYLAGEWSGPAKIEKGKQPGTNMTWKFTVNKPDLSDVAGIAINQLSGGKIDALNPAAHTIGFTLNYKVGGAGSFTIQCQGRFNAAYTEITGTFQNILGTGPFTITRHNTAPAADKFKGNWVGTVTPAGGAKKGEDPAKPFTLNVPEGKIDPKTACNFIDDAAWKINEVVPMLYKDGEKSFDFMLVGQAKGKGPAVSINFNGVFDDGFNELTGNYSGPAGKGTFKLVRMK